MDLFNLVGRIILNTDDYDRALDAAGQRSSSFSEKLKEGFSNAAKVAGAALGASTAAVVGFAKSAVDTGMQFDSAMSQVAATMNYSVEELKDPTTEASKEFNKLSAFAREMGATTSFSATEAADALNYMALAGYDAKTSMAMLPNVLNLAAAGDIELASASDMVTDAQSALGLSLEETAELVDKIAMTSSKSNTSVAQLGEAILTIGGTAKNVAGGTTELTTALGILADNGIKGAEGGTALRNIILSLSAPTDKAAKTMKRLGIEAYDAEGNMRPLNDIFNDMNGILSSMTQGEKTQVIDTIFNKQDLKSVDALLSNAGERFEELSGYIDQAQGSAENMANTQLDNLAGAIEIIKSAFGELQIEISNQLTPALRDFVEFGSKGISSLTTAFKEGGLSGAMDEFSNVLSEGLAMIFDKIPEMVSAGAQLLGALGEGILSNLPVVASAAAEVVSMLANGVMAALPSLAEGAASIMTEFGEYLRDNLPALLQTGLEMIVELTGSIRENAGKIVDGAIELAKNLAQGLMDSLPTIIENVPLIVSNIANVINDNAPKVFLAAVQIIATLVKGLISAIPTIIQNMPRIIAAIWDTITAVNWVNLGSTIIKGIGNGITSMVNFAKSSMDTVKTSIHNGISTLPETFRGIGRDMIQGLINGVKSMISAVGANIRSVGTSIISAAKSALGIHSPSKVFRDEVGVQIGLGLAEGIDASSDKALKATDDMAKSVYKKSKEWAERQSKLQSYTYAEQLELWETIQSQFIKGSQQYADAEEQIFDLRKKIREEDLKRQEEYAKKLEDTQKKISDLYQKYTDAVENRTKQIFDSYKLFDEIPKREEVSGKKLIDNLQEQLASMRSFYSGLSELENRTKDSGLSDYVRDMGISASGELDALLSMSDKQLDQYVALFGAKQRLANEAAVKELEPLREQTQFEIEALTLELQEYFDESAPDIGTALTAGIAKGIASGQSSVIDSAVKAATSAVEAVRNALGIHSPSTVFAGLGKNMALGLSEGWSDEISGVRKLIENGMTFDTANMDFAATGLGRSASQIASSAFQGGAAADIAINLTAELDGAMVARKLFRYNVQQQTIHGASFVGA